MQSDDGPGPEDKTVVEGAGRIGEKVNDGAGQIGPYRLIRELGRGGMGEVYLAEQLEPVQRKVALKLIGTRRSGSAFDAMFEVERQMLARMYHPAIAQVYDAGTAEDGRAYFAMEWVRGEPIVDHADHHALDERERLQLFIRVCRGIQHAHQQGVIHRDIKPDNVLVDRVDGVAMPKVIDFGIATGIVERDGSRYADSASSGRAGTRGYMSPEMVAGPATAVDTRTDVYSLGVLLFELLTSRRPPPADDSEALTEMREILMGSARTVRAAASGTERWTPRDLSGLGRELRWILARALAPEREARYDSAAALAEDLRRYLDGGVVEAVPATPAYRWRKFLQRNRLVVGVAAVVTVAVVSGLVVAVYGLLQARAQAERAEQIALFSTNMLDSIDPRIADGADTPVLDRVLSDAAERVGVELAGQPSIRAEIELTIGRAYWALGRLEPARRHLETVIKLFEGRRPEPAYLDAGALLVQIDAELARLDEAMARADHLLALAESDFARDQARRMRLLLAKSAVHFHAAEYDRVIALGQQVVEQIGPEADERLIGTRIDALRRVGQAYSELHQLDQAADWLGRAVSQARQWDHPVSRGLLVGLLNDRSVVLLRQQRYAEAEPLLREGAREGERLYGSDHPDVITIFGNLGGSIRQQGGQDNVLESLPFYEKSRDLALERYGPQHPRSVASTYNLGNVYRDLGRIDDALAAHREAFARRDAFAESHLFQGLVYLGLGQSELATGNLSEARDLLLIAIDRLETLVGPRFHRRIEAMEALAETLDAMQRPDEAEQWRRQAEALTAQGDAT
ncbi:MAG: tetratricopeptide repeat protein [Pseudomonadota bacterium]|nr:MAG: tetratricopeptide repeat protein [Pseudomonadota bacterium]